MFAPLAFGLSRGRSRCRRLSRSQRRVPHSCRLGVETLEPRNLLSLSPVGAAFRVNDTMFLDQLVTPGGAVAADGSGSFAVVWSSQQADGSGDEVYVRAHNADGNARTVELCVNEYGAGDQTAPAIASDDLGNMVIVWQSAGQDGDGWGVYGRRFSDSELWADEFHVSQTVFGNQTGARAAWDARSRFVVVWTSVAADAEHSGIFARQFEFDGTPLGDEFRVDGGFGAVGEPTIGMNADGDFLVAWTAWHSDGTRDVYARFFDPEGEPLADAFPVNSFTPGDQAEPTAAMADSGDVVISWSSLGQDGDGWGVYARQYDLTGIPQGDEFRVNTWTFNDQQQPAVAMDRGGNFVITWTSWHQDMSGAGVYAQAYDTVGAPRGAEFRVNFNSGNDQHNPSVAVDAEGNMIVVWQGWWQEDGHEADVFAQRYQFGRPDVRLLKDIEPGPNGSWVWPASFVQAGGRAFFVTDSGTGAALWTTEDSADGTTLVKTFPPSNLIGWSPAAAMGNTYFFALHDVPARSSSLWKSDGTPGGTLLVKAFSGLDLPYDLRFNISDSTVVSGTATSTLYFTVDDGQHGRELWATDGTAGGTQRVTSFAPRNALDYTPSSGAHLIVAGNRLFFQADDGAAGRELWMLTGNPLDGKPQTVSRVADINPGPGDAFRGAWAQQPVRIGNLIYFIADDGQHGKELWRSDGTAAGTRLVNDIRWGAAGAFDAQGAGFLTPAAGASTLYFAADDGRHGVEVWSHDTSTGGTRLVKDITPGPTGSFGPEAGIIGHGNGTLFLVASDGVHGRELWKSDGTEGGTLLVKDVNPHGDGASVGEVGPRLAAAMLGGTVYFTGCDDIHGCELWRSDGTPQGTARVTDLNPGNPADQPRPWYRTGPNGLVYLFEHEPVYGHEPWIVDPLAPHPAGPEFRVNANPWGAQFTGDWEQNPRAVALDADGDFVVTWTQWHDGSGHGVFAQRFDAEGRPQGEEFRVNSFINNNQQYSAVGMDADGDFVIAWMSQDQDGDGWGIYAQRYAAAGEPVGDEFRVNTYTADDQQFPAVAMDAEGNFAIAWTSYGQDGDGPSVFARWYDATGAAPQPEFQVHDLGGGWQLRPAVAMSATGEFIVTWTSWTDDGNRTGIYARRGGPEGPRGNEELVNSEGSGWVWESSVAMDASGGFVVAWSQQQNVEPYFNTVYARHFDLYDAPRPPVMVAEGGYLRNPTVATNAVGDFLVAWSAWDADSGGWSDVFARRFGRNDEPQHQTFRVNSFVPEEQIAPSAAMDADGNAVIVWSTWNQDGSEWGVYGQRYDSWTHPSAPVIAGVHGPDGERILEGATLTRRPESLVVSFSEDLATSGAGSVLDPANWDVSGVGVLGEPLPQAIPEISFGYHAATNRYEAALWFGGRLRDGAYTLTARQTIQDRAGIPLDGDRDGIPGGDFVLHFDVLAAAPQPAGDEFRVHATTDGGQHLGWGATHSAGTDAQGNFVVVWTDDGTGENDHDVRGRLFDATGNPRGDEFQVNPWSGYHQSPTVAMNGNGDFAVVWEAWSSDGSVAGGVYLGLFDSTGELQQAPLLVTQTGYGPDVAMDADGGVLVVWTEWGRGRDGTDVYAQRFDRNGVPQGSDFRVNTYRAGDQSNPSVGMDAVGNSVVVWSSDIQDGTGGVFAQRYGAIGQPQGDEFRVNAYHDRSRRWWNPAVAMAPAGAFVVAWATIGPDTWDEDIFVRQYDALGRDLGPEFRANAWTPGNQNSPALATDDDGFVVAWTGPWDLDGGAREILARQYNAQGRPASVEFRVNTYTHSIQDTSSVAIAPAGSFVVAWNSQGQDPDGSPGVYAQVYGTARNHAPMAHAGGPYTAYQGQPITLDASLTSDREQPHTELIYEWDLDYDGTWFHIDAVGMQPVVSFPAIFPPRQIAVRITDAGRLTDIAVTTLEVLRGPGTIAGVKWDDLNGNGVRDAGEPGLNGWTIHLYDALGNLSDSDVTHDWDLNGDGVIDPAVEAGWYRFEHLSEGVYEIEELLQTGWYQTYPAERHRVTVGPDVQFPFTRDADFDRGILLQLNHDPPNNDQLQVNEPVVVSFPFINVAASSRGTLVRIDTETGDIVGEYCTAPEGRGGNPSRTTVDLYGNVWVGNRAEEGFIGPLRHGSVTKIGIVIGGTRGDKNPDGILEPNPDGGYLQGPFAYCTCVDRDGDGLIRTSGRIGQILAWPDITDGLGGTDNPQGDGKPGEARVLDAYDECIVVYQRLPDAEQVRHVSVDRDNNVWVGGYPHVGSPPIDPFELRSFHKLDGETGAVLDSFDARPFGAGGYGGLVDGSGILWSASVGSAGASHGLLRYDPVQRSGFFIPVASSYGLAADSRGFIWNVSHWDGHVVKLDPAGNIMPGFPKPVLPDSAPGVASRGVAVTPDDDVWVANTNRNNVSRLDNNGNIKAVIPVGDSPTGVAVDADGKVWVTNMGSNDAMRIDPSTNLVDRTVPLDPGAGPYNYSDMTGHVAVSKTVPQGIWSVVQDAGGPFVWTSTAWNREPQGSQPPGSSITVEFRAADDPAALGGRSFIPASNGGTFAAAGRFLEVRATLRPAVVDGVNISPVLSDLSVSGHPRHDFGNAVDTLKVTALTPTTTGFTATFNRPVEPAVLNLYDDASQLWGPADVTLVGDAVGLVFGSLVLTDGNQRITFVQRDGPLAADTYTVTLFSRPDGFRDLAGQLLDGDGDGTPGDDYAAPFTIAPSPLSEVVLSIADFARGYGQTVNLPTVTDVGIPLTLSTGQDVSSVDFDLRYDPALLTITGFATGIPGAGAAYHVLAPGLARFTVSSNTQFASSSGPLELGRIQAVVPQAAPYGSKHVLDLVNVVVHDNHPVAPQPRPSRDDDGVHLAAFVGDSNGSRSYAGSDVSLLQRVIVGSATGFSRFPLADPLLIGDVHRNAVLNGADATLLQRVVVGIPVPYVPPIPAGISFAPDGPDPRVFIPTDLAGQTGHTVTVPVNLAVTEVEGMQLSSVDLVVAYDADHFTVDSFRLGSLLAGAGFSSPVVNTSVPGLIRCTMSTAGQTSLLAHNSTGSLLEMDFAVHPGAAAGTSRINLMAMHFDGAMTTTTNLSDARGRDLVLTPPPTNDEMDPVDGVFTIIVPPGCLILPTGLNDIAGNIVTLPLDLTVTQASGMTISSVDLALAFDPDRLAVENVRLGALLADAGFSGPVVNIGTPGLLRCTTSTPESTPWLPPGTAGSLLLIDFAVLAGSQPGPTWINLLASGGDGVSLTTTGLVDASLVELPLDYTSEALFSIAPFTNPVLREDVNGDGSVEPLDVLILINWINAHGVRDLLYVVAHAEEEYFFDVARTRSVGPLDVLIVINYINRRSAGMSEGEMLPSAAEPQPGPTSTRRAAADRLPEKRAGAFAMSVERRSRPTATRVVPRWNTPDPEDDLFLPLEEDLLSELAAEMARAGSG